jgi:hypothetical protein
MVNKGKPHHYFVYTLYIYQFCFLLHISALVKSHHQAIKNIEKNKLNKEH